jgi:hypothetical protein
MKAKVTCVILAISLFNAIYCAAGDVLLEHWTQRSVPGQCHLDAWGWHGAVWYQQTYSEGVDFDYLTDRVVAESYHWGANLLELYSTDFQRSIKAGERFHNFQADEGYDFIIETGSNCKLSKSSDSKLTLTVEGVGTKEDLLFLGLNRHIDSNEHWAAFKETLAESANPNNILVRTGETGYLFKPDSKEKPRIRLFRIMNPCRSPYYVKEFSPEGREWWTFRGAQASVERPGTDLLRVYTRPGKSSGIIFDGFINGLARPGWGNQYSIVLRDPVKEEDKVKLAAKVMSLTPLLFAPRVQFSKPVRNIRVKGKDWAYNENDIVFLPRIEGEYDIEAEFGRNSNPCLRRTQACVSYCRFSEGDKCLTIKWQNVKWSEKLPEEQVYCATIETGDRETSSIYGGEVILKGRDMVNIKMLEPEVKLYFN